MNSTSSIVKKSLLLLSLTTICIGNVFASHKVNVLMQSDFDSGTYLIDKPGKYILGENISFKPNAVGSKCSLDAYTAGFPFKNQFLPVGIYDPAAFGIGFFSAIAISAKNVELDLAGHTIEQSKEHALLMRFFSIIELADRPFVPKQGPHNFGNEIKSAENVVIKNGIIGRSAHHGIHCNGCKNIIIKDVDFKDFEVAAVALNGVQGLKVKNVTAESRKDVPVLGTFSAAQFIKPYVDFLVSSGSEVKLNLADGSSLSAADIRNSLRNSILNVYEDVIANGSDKIDSEQHPSDYALYHNDKGIVDGNAYAFLVNSFGVAINGLSVRPAAGGPEPSKNISFKNVSVKKIHADIREVPVLKNASGKGANDPVGAAFQVQNRGPMGNFLTINDNEEYIGNVIANAQALVAKAKGEFPQHLDVSRLSIDDEILKWVEKKSGYETLSKLRLNLGHDILYFCNGDSMFHVNKGVISFRIDASENITIMNTSIAGTKNFGAQGIDLCDGYLNEKSHPSATLLGYGGSVARGVSVSGASRTTLTNVDVTELSALSGSAIGFDILTDSEKTYIKSCRVDNVDAGSSYLDEGAMIRTAKPDAVGFQFGMDTTKSILTDSCVSNLTAHDETIDVRDDSGGNLHIVKQCQ